MITICITTFEIISPIPISNSENPKKQNKNSFIFICYKYYGEQLLMESINGQSNIDIL